MGRVPGGAARFSGDIMKYSRSTDKNGGRRIGSPKVGSGYFLVIKLLADSKMVDTHNANAAGGSPRGGVVDRVLGTSVFKGGLRDRGIAAGIAKSDRGVERGGSVRLARPGRGWKPRGWIGSVATIVSQAPIRIK